MNAPLKSCIHAYSAIPHNTTIFTKQGKLTLSQMMDRKPAQTLVELSQHHGAKPCDSTKRSRASPFEAGARKAAEGCVGWDSPRSVDSEIHIGVLGSWLPGMPLLPEASTTTFCDEVEPRNGGFHASRQAS